MKETCDHLLELKLFRRTVLPWRCDSCCVWMLLPSNIQLSLGGVSADALNLISNFKSKRFFTRGSFMYIICIPATWHWSLLYQECLRDTFTFRKHSGWRVQQIRACKWSDNKWKLTSDGFHFGFVFFFQSAFTDPKTESWPENPHKLFHILRTTKTRLFLTEVLHKLKRSTKIIDVWREVCVCVSDEINENSIFCTIIKSGSSLRRCFACHFSFSFSFPQTKVYILALFHVPSFNVMW